MNFILNLNLPMLIEAIGYLGIFLIIFAESGLFFGFFLPGDTLLFTAGILASQGYLDIVIVLLITVFGAVLGDQIGYLFGKKFGPKIFKHDESFFFKKRYVVQAEDFYKKYGKKTVLLSRFMPVIRTFIPILAGVAKMRYKTFIIYNVIGGILWGMSITLLGYFLGQRIPNIEAYLIPILLLIIFISVLPTLFSFIRAKIKK